jgi:hypothetical protein
MKLYIWRKLFNKNKDAKNNLLQYLSAADNYTSQQDFLREQLF